MRIIAGEARRVQLDVADETSTRPFLEMARGALFNSLGDRVAGAAVLDCFAGSGALGLEALSRGAASCVFVEMDARAVKALTANIARCRMADRSRVVRGNVFHAVGTEPGMFDLIFVDPPFKELRQWGPDGQAAGAMRRIAEILSPDGQVVFRVEDKKFAPPDWPGLRLDSDRRYGRSRICRYGRESD
ncbi:MAG: 16S rRNA (guanine(966)-N(2))-methyltransferase RsmD [Planctomycetaceae bacterium]|nr:16S rRNA (guanine(966)-N(2))-methyltransferase RsmD [Planctomycetaceae bacterium]